MQTLVGNFVTQSYLSYKALFFWLNWPAYTSNVFIRPVLLMAMFSLAGRFAGDEGAAACCTTELPNALLSSAGSDDAGLRLVFACCSMSLFPRRTGPS